MSSNKTLQYRFKSRIGSIMGARIASIESVCKKQIQSPNTIAFRGKNVSYHSTSSLVLVSSILHLCIAVRYDMASSRSALIVSCMSSITG